MTEAVQSPRSRRKSRVGRVVSNKMEKTAVVEEVDLSSFESEGTEGFHDIRVSSSQEAWHS